MFGSNNEKRDGKLKAANQKMRASTGASNVFGEDEYLIYYNGSVVKTKI